MQSLQDFLADHVVVAETLFFVVLILSIWFTEAIVALRPWSTKWRHTKTNLGFVATALPVQATISLGMIVAAEWGESHQFGLAYLLPFSSNPLVFTGVVLLIMDFGDYVYHRAMHGLPILWRFHVAHHSDLEVDVSTTLREHPVETAFRSSMMIVFALLSGATVEILALRQGYMSIINLWSHTSITLPQRLAYIVQWFVVTPNFHRVHHHTEPEHTDTNFGDGFTVWDRLFGTYDRLPAAEIKYGVALPAPYSPERFRDLLIAPFSPPPIAVEPS